MKHLKTLFVLLILGIVVSTVAAQNQDDIQDNPEAYFNQTVTVEGVVDIVSPNAFELTQTDPFDLSPGSILVVPGLDDDFSIDINNGMRVRVTGTFNQYDLAGLEASLGYDLDDNALVDYDLTDYTITATSVTLLGGNQAIMDRVMTTQFEADPGMNFNQTVTVEGTANIVSPNAFELTNTQPFDLSPGSILVFPGAADNDFSIDINNGMRVRVTGTFTQYDLATMESSLGADLDDNALVNYDTSDYAITATSVTRLSEADLTDATTAFRDVTTNRDMLIGEIVTVTGYIDEDVDLASGNFVLRSDDLLYDDRVLVLSATDVETTAMDPLAENFFVNDRIVVAGTVRDFSMTDLETELGYALDENQYNAYQDLPVVVAYAVEHASETDTMTNQTMGTFDRANYANYPVADDVDLDTVLDDPAAYYGQIVTVDGDIAEFVEGQRGFLLGDEDLINPERALIIGADQPLWDSLIGVEIDDTVIVRGIVRPLNITDLENEIGYDMDDEFYAEFTGDDQTAIIALEVTPRE